MNSLMTNSLPQISRASAAIRSNKTFIAIACVTLLLSACGGGDLSVGVDVPIGPSGSGTPNVAPLLQAGMQRQFAGSVVRVVTYAMPDATHINNTLAYTFNQTQNVLQAPASAPANFDLNSTYTYTITQDPGTGSVPIAQTVDDYRDLYLDKYGQYTVDVAQTSSAIASDETANALGGGPYQQTTQTSTNYTTPRAGLYFPLQSGDSITLPQSYTQTVSFTNTNSANVAPPNNVNQAYTRSRTEYDDGAFFYQQNNANGSSVAVTQHSDGTGSITSANATNSTTHSVGLPSLLNGGYTIPITSAVTSSTSTITNYAALDWYPSGALPNEPLVSETQTVVGPVSSLPAQCSGALVLPNVMQINTVTTSLNTVQSSYSTTNTQSFNSNGITLCSLSTQTTNSYSLETGLLFSTTVTTTNLVLTASN